MKKILFVVVWIILFFIARENSGITILTEHLSTAAVTLVFTFFLFWALFRKEWNTGVRKK